MNRMASDRNRQHTVYTSFSFQLQIRNDSRKEWHACSTIHGVSNDQLHQQQLQFCQWIVPTMQNTNVNTPPAYPLGWSTMCCSVGVYRSSWQCRQSQTRTNQRTQICRIFRVFHHVTDAHWDVFQDAKQKRSRVTAGVLSSQLTDQCLECLQD